MAGVLPSHDLEGRDVQASVNAGESTSNAPRGEHGRILLSMVTSGGLVEHAVIPLPDSYLAAKAMAVDVFHTQMECMGMAVERIVLKLGVKSSSGTFVWAQFHPDKWVEVIRDGDEVCVEGGSNLHVSGIIVTFYNPYMRLGDGCCRISTTLPSTYEHAEAIVRQQFHSSIFPEQGVALIGTKKDIDGKYEPTRILPSQWVPTIVHMIKENPAFEIVVYQV